MLQYSTIITPKKNKNRLNQPLYPVNEDKQLIFNGADTDHSLGIQSFWVSQKVCARKVFQMMRLKGVPFNQRELKGVPFNQREELKLVHKLHMSLNCNYYGSGFIGFPVSGRESLMPYS